MIEDQEFQFEETVEIPESESIQGEPSGPPRLTGQDVARVFATMFAPPARDTSKPLTPEEAREAFITDYTASVGTILDLLGFSEAAERLDPGRIPAGIRVGIGVGVMVVMGLLLRRRYGQASQGGDVSGHGGIGQNLGAGVGDSKGEGAQAAADQVARS